MHQLDVQQEASMLIERTPKRAKDILMPKGRFVVQHWRNGKRINEYHFNNGVTDEGKNHLLDVGFDGGTQVATWYLGLIDNAGFTALADDDTYDDINQAGNGWDEFDDYTDPANADSAVTRPAWTPGEPSAASITNATVVEYDITAAGTVKGLFVVGGGTSPEDKGDHAAGSTLWATALFSAGDAPVNNGDTLKVTYTISL